MKRIPMINGSEYDHLTRWKRFHNNNHSKRAKVKRGYRRRERANGRKLIFKWIKAKIDF